MFSEFWPPYPPSTFLGRKYGLPGVTTPAHPISQKLARIWVCFLIESCSAHLETLFCTIFRVVKYGVVTAVDRAHVGPTRHFSYFWVTSRAIQDMVLKLKILPTGGTLEWAEVSKTIRARLDPKCRPCRLCRPGTNSSQIFIFFSIIIHNSKIFFLSELLALHYTTSYISNSFLHIIT